MDALPLMARFTGIPYVERGSTFEGADCWGVVELYLLHVGGLSLPGFSDVREPLGNRISDEELACLVSDNSKWTPAVVPYQVLDVLVFRVGRSLHAGVVVDDRGWMLNARRGTGSVVSDLSERIWTETLIGGYRHHAA